LRKWNADLSPFVENLLDEAPLLGKEHDVETSPLFYYGTVRPRTVGMTITYRPYARAFAGRHPGGAVEVTLLMHMTSTADRCDCALFSPMLASMGSFVGGDITQGVDIVPFDVESSPADFVVSTT
jgi:hypothetical protein